MYRFNALLNKEWLEAIRDKRALFLTLFMGLMGPGLFILIFTLLQNEVSSNENTTVKLINLQYPALENFLTQQGFEQDLDADISIEFPADMTLQLAKAKPVTITIKGNLANQSNQSSASNIERSLTRFSQQIGTTRLIARGINPTITQPFDIQLENTANPTSSGAIIVESMLHLFIMVIFIGGMSYVIDSSAGERERHSLELLLMQPISTTEVILAKASMAWLLSMTTFVIAFLGVLIVFRLYPANDFGLSVVMSLFDALFIIIAFLPLSLLAVLLEYQLAFQSKSYKEAQSYMNFVVFIPMGLSMWLQFSSADHALIAWLPLVGQQHILDATFKDQAADWYSYGGVFLLTCLIDVLLILILAKRLRNEKTILGL
jgi:sodium transport system permease protein